MATDGSDMVLYWASGSPSAWLALIALHEKKLDKFKSNLLIMSKGEQNSAEVLAINPRGQVPTFRHGDNVVNESMAIGLYLESVFKNQGTKLLPDHPGHLALVLQRFMEVKNLDLKMRAHLVPIMMKGGIENVDKDVEAVNRKAVVNEFVIWEGHLQAGYAAVECFSLADVALFPSVASAVRAGLPGNRFPNIHSYVNRLYDRESIKKTFPPHWANSPGLNIYNDV